MPDKVHPSPNPAATNGGANPANKPQLPRPRPPPRRCRHRRGCCCSICICTTLAILSLLLIATIAGAVFYVVYRPHRPSFAVNSLRLSRFNLTRTSLSADFNLSISARNPNKKITFFYDLISVKILSGDVDIGHGSLPGFTHGGKNVTTLTAAISSSDSPFPAGTDISQLKSSFESKSLPLKILLETRVKVKVAKIKTRNVKIRVICDGIKIPIPTRKTATTAAMLNVKCKVDPRMKFMKWSAGMA